MKEVYAELSVQSDVLTPERISSMLGMACDDSCVKGALKPPHNVVRYKHHCWSVQTHLPPEATVEEHLADLLERLEPVKGTLEEMSAEAEVKVACVIYTPEAENMLFDPRTIATIAEMGAWFWIDLYVIPEDESSAA